MMISHDVAGKNNSVPSTFQIALMYGKCVIICHHGHLVKPMMITSWVSLILAVPMRDRIEAQAGGRQVESLCRQVCKSLLSQSGLLRPEMKLSLKHLVSTGKCLKGLKSVTV